MKKYLWAFIVFVAAADICFTWRCRASASEWESNPLAGWVLGRAGASGAIVYRLFWLIFAGLMAQTHCRLTKLVTPVWAVGHVYLLTVLVQASAYAKDLSEAQITSTRFRPVVVVNGADLSRQGITAIVVSGVSSSSTDLSGGTHEGGTRSAGFPTIDSRTSDRPVTVAPHGSSGRRLAGL